MRGSSTSICEAITITEGQILQHYRTRTRHNDFKTEDEKGWGGSGIFPFKWPVRSTPEMIQGSTSWIECSGTSWWPWLEWLRSMAQTDASPHADMARHRLVHKPPHSVFRLSAY